MGCCIHIYTEIFAIRELYNLPIELDVQRETNINEILSDFEDGNLEKWVSADKWHFDINEDMYGDEYKDWYNEPCYNGRNYYLFNILAGVRDYNDNVKQIAPLRGVPDDASDAYKLIVDRWEGDGHSHSYYTLQELLNVDWDMYDKSHLLGFLKTIENLKELGEPSKVRILFFFDN